MNEASYARRTAQLLVAAMFSLGAEACGGKSNESANDEPGSPGTAAELICQPFTPCGGDLLGRWRIVSGCYDPEFLKGPCPAIAYHSLEEEGTYEFLPSGLYEFGPSSFSLTYTATYDASCNSACEPRPSSGERPVVETECFREGDTCRCETTSTGQSPAETHPYSISGNEVTLIVDEATGTYSRWQYCVQGDEASFYYERGGGFTLVRA